MISIENYAYYNYWTHGDSESYVTSKRRSQKAYEGYMISRLASMFKYKGLPDTIPQDIFENMLFMNGSCFITEGPPCTNNSRLTSKRERPLYAFIGSFGGEPDPYYRPTKYIIANPGLRFDKECDLWKDGVLIRNDILWMGLKPMIAKYSYLLAENTITLRVADIMLRVVSLLSAPDDKTYQAARAYLDDILEGKLGVIAESPFFDGIKLQSPPTSNGSYLTQFIELNQYLLGSFYNEIGLTATNNMKRETLHESEVNANEDILTPLITTMLRCRQEDLKRVNSMFGTNITCEFANVWDENMQERELELQSLKAQVSQLTLQLTPQPQPGGGDVNNTSGGDGVVGADSQLTENGDENNGVDGVNAIEPIEPYDIGTSETSNAENGASGVVAENTGVDANSNDSQLTDEKGESEESNGNNGEGEEGDTGQDRSSEGDTEHDAESGELGRDNGEPEGSGSSSTGVNVTVNLVVGDNNEVSQLIDDGDVSEEGDVNAESEQSSSNEELSTEGERSDGKTRDEETEDDEVESDKEDA